MRPRSTPRRALVAVSLLVAACASPPPDADDGPHVAIDIAPLQLSGITDATWLLAVDNGDGELIWQQTITSSGYGDGAGSASYVGPCDADSPENTVSLTLVDLSDASGVIAPSTYQNPTADGPLTRVFTCVENADVAVTFDVVVMRAAQQGFFDVAVNFTDIFCSGKVDCLDEDEQPIRLLFDATGARSTTVVVALACTAGQGQDTRLYWNDLTVACTGASVTVDPSGGPGNAGALPPVLFQHAVYRGSEQLGTYNKAYWNVALGLDLPAMATAGVHSCQLTGTATASDGGFTGGVSPAGTPWPVIDVDVALTGGSNTLSCTHDPLNGPSSGTTTVYGPTAGSPFCHEYDPDLDSGTPSPSVTDHCGGGGGQPVGDEFIVFSRGAGLVRDIWVMRADGSGPKAITDGSAHGETSPVWSPTNGGIAYIDISGGARNLFLVDVDGTNPLALTALTGATDSVGAPSFAPDGASVLVNQSLQANGYTNEIWQFAADGGGGAMLSFISVGFRPELSPDGSQIAYRGPSSPWIVRRPADGSGAPTALPNPLGAFVSNPAWSPGGTRLAVEGGGNIYLMDALDGGDAVLLVQCNGVDLPGECENPDFSGDGSTLIFDNATDIYAIPADGSAAPTNLTQNPGGTSSQKGAYVPAGITPPGY